MPCNMTRNTCGCTFNIKTFGACDVSRIRLNGSDPTQLNWNEISVPEVFQVPEQKPDIEHLDQAYVEAVIGGANLVETPFAYRIYDRPATALEISIAISAVNLAVIDLAPITEAVNAILAIPGLPAIPAVTALENALTAVETAGTNLTTAVTAALTALNAPCLIASALVSIIQTVIDALNALEVTLNLLIAAANALVTATAAIPVVGPLVAAAVALLITAINTVSALITTALTALQQAITTIGATSVLVITSNEEGTCLSGRKLIIEGMLNQKVVYTGLVPTQTVHSVCRSIPFSAYIIPYASFEGLTLEKGIAVVPNPSLPCETITVNGFPYTPGTPLVVNLCEEFCVSSCIEDIFVDAIDTRTIFKNVTLFLSAKPAVPCQ